ncbi:MAG: diaminopimelate epimerase [Myxococcales bacterium]|nr:diaminopimelate epimerase [Myxococcales bacterium]MCB9735653.1 diaminopimelate epimerase [Deltaproteobacteria bacterium]
MNFVKYHGLGNDFVLLRPGEDAARWFTPERARAICRRGFGVGGDGLMAVGASTAGDVAMLLLNSDGSVPEMCGNGIRCFVKFVVDHLGEVRNPLRVETPGGVRACRWTRGADGRVATVEVDMGAPSFDRARIPMSGEGSALEVALEAEGRTFVGTGVNTGNPHFVVFGGAERELARTYGPALEQHPAFIAGANVEFAAIEARDLVRVSVWERGCGLTEACGTGATATVAAGVRLGILPIATPIRAILPGGQLTIRVDEGFETAWMEGPATEVYAGVLTA